MRKIRRALYGALLAIGTIAALAIPAQSAIASNVNDCFPASCSGYYSSSDSGHGRGGWDAYKSGLPSLINWNYSASSVEVEGNVYDAYSDSNGPALQVKVNGTIHNWHWTGGTGTGHWYDEVYDVGLVNDSTEVSFRMCNGYSGSTPVNCESSWHGPFHRY